MTPKHIALFVRYLPIGGIQKVVVRLANEFARRGHSVDLVLAKEGGAMEREVSPDVRIVNLDHRRVWTALPSLVRYLYDERPDVLFSAEAPVNLIAIWARMLFVKPLRLVVSVHSNMSEYAKGGEIWYGRYIPGLISFFYPFADKIVTVSRGVFEDLASMSSRMAEKACVIYYPLIEETIFEKAMQPVSHSWLESSDYPVILGVGRLTRQKNFDLLLRSFARLQERQEARLIILGDGNQRSSLEAQMKELGIEDRVDLYGFVDNPYPFMARASLFALSSDFEGFGIVVVEALACGCPVVSTDCPSGPREILEDGKWGRLVPVGDEQALAEAMERALSETHDPDRLRERAEDFAVDEAVDTYLEVLLSNR